MENFPKPNKGGRPRKIPQSPLNSVGEVLGEESPERQKFAREFFADALRTDRSRANGYYADIARDVVGGLSKLVEIPHDPVLAAKTRAGMDWIMSRRTVLAELGRMMDQTGKHPTDEERAQFQAVVHRIASRHDKMTAKTACAYIRGRRMGETSRRDRVAALHHDLNAAINLHRQRFPESTWADIRRALEMTVGQVARKL
jgi:hypothetical protein